MTKGRRLVPGALLAVVLAGGIGVGRAQVMLPTDHLVCAKLRDSVPRASYTVRLGPSLQDDLVGCVVKLPAKLACQSTSKSAVTPPPPGGGPTGSLNRSKFLCYKLKCPTAANDFHTAKDQFGIHDIVLGTSKLLCAPASPGGAFLDPTE